MEEAVQLCKNMSIADAYHDNTIVKNVQELQERCETDLNRLIRLLDGILDEATVRSKVAVRLHFARSLCMRIFRGAGADCRRSDDSDGIGGY